MSERSGGCRSCRGWRGGGSGSVGFLKIVGFVKLVPEDLDIRLPLPIGMVNQVLFCGRYQFARSGVERNSVVCRVGGWHTSHQGCRERRSGVELGKIGIFILRCNIGSWSPNLDMRASLRRLMQGSRGIDVADYYCRAVRFLKYRRCFIDIHPDLAVIHFLGIITGSNKDRYVII